VLNFQEGFWIPFVEKAAWRYMQFDPENYPVKDYKFLVESTLGTMAREYQVSQLVQLMQTASPESPIYPALVQAVVDNMDVENREELNAALKKAAQPDPEEQQRQQQMEQMQLDMQIRQGEAQIAVFEAQAAESNARAEKYTVEAQLEPRKVENDRIDAVADIRDGVTAEQFNRRLKVAETKLRERELNIKEKDIDLRRKNEKEAQNMINSSE
jgi:hypothetical protein